MTGTLRRTARTGGRFILYTAVAALFVLLTAFSRPAAQGARTALLRCGETLIPSLFPFLVLSGYAVRCGFAERCGRLLSRLTETVFFLPGSCAAVILTALVGGYPVGARGIRSLLDRGAVTQEQAQRMTLFCVGAGPGFVVAAVGEGIFHSTPLGLILLAAQVAAALLLGILTGILARKQGKKAVSAAAHTRAEPPGIALVSSVTDGAQAMLSLCAFVVLFGTLIGLLGHLGIDQTLAEWLQHIGVPASAGAAFFPILLEVCSGTAAAADAAGAAVPLIAFSLGWGGLCVHFQIFSSLGTLSFSKARFFLFRALHGALAAGFSLLLLPLLPQGSIDVSGGVLQAQAHQGIPFTLALLMLIFVFLLSLPSGSGNSEEKMVK